LSLTSFIGYIGLKPTKLMNHHFVYNQNSQYASTLFTYPLVYPPTWISNRTDHSIYVSSLNQVTHFENVIKPNPGFSKNQASTLVLLTHMCYRQL